MNIITDIDQFQNGRLFSFDSVREQRDWYAWYAGNFGTLLPSPTIDNGLKLFALADLITWNPYFIFSGVNRISTVGDPPAVSSKVQEMQAWMDVNYDYIFEHYITAAEDWSVADESIWMTFENQTMDVIKPFNYFRRGTPQTPDDQTDHVIVLLYPEQTSYVLSNPHIQHQPTLADIYRYGPNVPEQSGTFETLAYEGNYTSGIFGRTIEAQRPAGITSIRTAGRGLSWYPHSRPIVARAMTQLTNLDAELNAYRNAPNVLPSNIINASMPPGVDPSGMSASQRLEALRKTVKPVLAADEDSGGNPGQYLHDEPAFEAADSIIKELRFLTQLTAGLSPQTLGFDVGGNHSGVAVDRMQDVARARGRYYRRRGTAALYDIAIGLGAPDVGRENLSVVYFTDPFQSIEARIEQLMMLNEKKIITVNETRQPLGYEPVEGGDTLVPETPTPEPGGNQDD